MDKENKENQNKEKEKDKVLVTFAGTTDPTRGNYDGPIIHICRYYEPKRIYLLLTAEMKKNDIYEEAIKENLKDYFPEVIKIETEIKEAHLFNAFFEHIYGVFERVKKENPEAEVLVNVSSGTAQMITNLITYIIDNNTDMTLQALQVSSPEKASNRTAAEKKETYDIKQEAQNNFDNDVELRKKRIIEPNLRGYSRIFVKNQIKKLLEQYEYLAASELIHRDIFTKNQLLKTLLNFAIDRKNLVGLSSNNKLGNLDDKKYDKKYDKKCDKLYYYSKKKDIKSVPNWYKIVDYFALADIKQRVNDISGYILMLEPMTVEIYKSIFTDILKIRLDEFFKYDARGWKVDPSLLCKKLKDFIRDDSNINIEKGRADSYISDKILSSTIKYLIKNKNLEAKMELKFFENFSEELSKVKEIRNYLAHNIETISRKDFEERAKIKIEHLNHKILEFFKKYYKPLGYKTEMVEIYDNINSIIFEILAEEK